MGTLQIILLACAIYIGLYTIVNRICNTVDKRSIAMVYTALGIYGGADDESDENKKSDTSVENDRLVYRDIRIGSAKDAETTFGEGAGYCYSCHLREQCVAICHTNDYVSSYCPRCTTDNKVTYKTDGQYAYIDFLDKKHSEI